jgi:hypothetical protein
MLEVVLTDADVVADADADADALGVTSAIVTEEAGACS